LNRINITQQQAVARELAREFAESTLAPLAVRHDRDEEIQWSLFHQMAKADLLRANLPTEYGGLGDIGVRYDHRGTRVCVP
jgi:alkylation response protein AidB-like acyl-CoA dehydrogenase